MLTSMTMRNAVKKAARQLYHDIVGNDETLLAELVLWLLEKPGRRNVLGKHLWKINKVQLHNLLWRVHFVDNKEIQERWPSESFCNINSKSAWYLDPQKFRNHLGEMKPERSELRTIVITACAFAMLQPDIAQQILRILIAYDPQLEEALTTSPVEEKNGSLSEPRTRTKSTVGSGNATVEETFACPDEASCQNLESQGGELPMISGDVVERSKPFELHRGWINTGRAIVENFLKAHAEVSAGIQALGDRMENLRLDGKRIPEVLLDAHNPMVQAAGKLDIWIDEWSESVRELLTQPGLPPPIGELYTVSRLPRVTVGGMEDCCHKLERIFEDLNHFSQALGISIQGRQARIRSIEEDLKQFCSFDGTLPHDDLLAAIRFDSELEKREEMAGQKRNLALRARREDLLSIVAELGQQLVEAHPELGARKIALKEALTDSTTLRHLDEREKEIEALREEVEKITPLATPGELAGAALLVPTAVASVLKVVRALLERGFAEEAVTLMVLVQEGREVESVEHLDLGEFTSILLECCSALAKNPALASSWPQIFFSNPWIARVNTGDICDETLRYRLAAAFLALHRFSDSSTSLGLFYTLGLNLDAFPETCSALNGLVRFIVKQEPLGIISTSGTDETIRREQELAFLLRKTERNSYARQAAHGDEVAEMERETLFPSLEDLWRRIRAACQQGNLLAARELVNHRDDLVSHAFRKHNLSAAESPFYRKLMFNPQNGYLTDFKKLTDRFIDAWEERERVSREQANHVAVEDIATELRHLLEVDEGARAYWSTLMADLACVEDPYPGERTFIDHAAHPLLDHCAGTIALVPGSVVDYCRLGADYRPDATDFTRALEELAEQDKRRSLAQLVAARCYRHAGLLLKSLHEENDSVLQNEEYVELARRMQEEHDTLFMRLIHFTEPQNTIFRITTDIQLGHFINANRLISGLEKHRNYSLNIRYDEHIREISELRYQSEQIEVFIMEANADESWVEEAESRIERLRREFNRIRRNAAPGAPAFEDLTRFPQALIALRYIVDHRSFNFDEFDALVPIKSGWGRQATLPAGDQDSEDNQLPAELLNAWQMLASQKEPTGDNIRNAWGTLAKEFSRANGLFHDPKQTLTASAVKNYYNSFATRFHDPRSRWLDRKISLMLVLKGTKNNWQHLKAHVDDSGEAINIVFAPDAADEWCRLWRHDPRKDNYIVVDEPMLRSFYDPTESGIALRQALHRQSVDLTSIGLFKSEGYVHRRKNVFVGREKAILQIAQQQASAIWGGRRIGKTSLLHAVSDRLRYYGFKRIADVYVYHFDGDPDLQLAGLIAHELGLPEPASIEQFRKELVELSREFPVAILIDEMDFYIEASRKIHGPTSFPLARMLRGLVQADTEQRRFKVVYAGFKQLYYEVKLRPNDDAGDPFKNFLEPVTKDFGNLTFEQVDDFLRIAFREMIGIDYEPGVPRLVKDKTLGHPAFIQVMGERLLGLVSHRARTSGKLSLTARDVEQVYCEESDLSGYAYIDYVGETLGWNLSMLGRAIMVALSIEIKSSALALDHFFTRGEIVRTLIQWVEKDTYIPSHDCPDVKRTLDFLVMTNMLTSKGEAHPAYSIAYPFYVDVMTRLGDSDRLKVTESIDEYQKHDRGWIK